MAPVRLPATGTDREIQALTVATDVAAVFAAAEAVLITLITRAVRRVAVTGPGTLQATAVKLARQAAMVIAAAERRADRLLTAAGPPSSLAATRTITGNTGRTAYSTVNTLFTAAAEIVLAAGAGKRGATGAAARTTADKVAAAELAHGITGYTGTDGRRWHMASYIGVAVTGAVSHAWDAELASTVTAAGGDLVLVVHHWPLPPCRKCRPYVGKLLSLTGSQTGTFSVTGSAGRRLTATTAGTLAQAEAEGFRHAWCRCTLVPWVSGADPAAAQPPTSSQDAWAAAQARYTANRNRAAAARTAALPR